ncbi:MAG: 5-formyltetrahydrofolate cyclo-ligase [Lachnospiraceae bacterium]|nr:5-formyltetrahydrofolate cyclo-ligase [Lachnospiraceae bacterium]
MIHDLKAEKTELRRQMKALRAGFTGAARKKADEAVWRQVLALPAFEACETVFGYASFGTEIDTGKFLQACLDAGKRLFLPKVTGKQMIFRRVEDLACLVPGVWGIREPDESCEAAEPDKDFAGSFCLMPGLAFDRMCHRLGYGGGYYDRTFAGEPAVYFCAAAYSFQIADHVPADGRDIKVSVIVTEKEVIPS